MDINIFRKHLANFQKNTISESVEVVDDSQRPVGNAEKNDAYIVFQNSVIKDRSLWLPDRNDQSVFSRSELKNVFRWHHGDNTKNEGGLVKIDLKRGIAQFINKDKFEKMGGSKLPNSVWDRPLKIVRFRHRVKKALDHAK